VILLVNASEHAAAVTLSAPQMKGKPLWAWRPDRQIKAGTQGSFADQLGAFDVRVYSSEARSGR